MLCGLVNHEWLCVKAVGHDGPHVLVNRCEFIGEVEVFGLPGYMDERCILGAGHTGWHKGSEHV